MRHCHCFQSSLVENESILYQANFYEKGFSNLISKSICMSLFTYNKHHILVNHVRIIIFAVLGSLWALWFLQYRQTFRWFTDVIPRFLHIAWWEMHGIVINLNVWPYDITLTCKYHFLKNMISIILHWVFRLHNSMMIRNPSMLWESLVL